MMRRCLLAAAIRMLVYPRLTGAGADPNSECLGARTQLAVVNSALRAHTDSKERLEFVKKTYHLASIESGREDRIFRHTASLWKVAD